MNQFYWSPLLTEWSHATEPFPYFTKTWEATRCQAKTYSPFFLHQRQTKRKVLLQKLNTWQANKNNNNNNNNNNHIVSSFAYYSIWIINLILKLFRFWFCFVREIICQEHVLPQNFVLFIRHILQYPRHKNWRGVLVV